MNDRDKIWLSNTAARSFTMFLALENHISLAHQEIILTVTRVFLRSATLISFDWVLLTLNTWWFSEVFFACVSLAAHTRDFSFSSSNVHSVCREAEQSWTAASFSIIVSWLRMNSNMLSDTLSRRIWSSRRDDKLFLIKYKMNSMKKTFLMTKRSSIESSWYSYAMNSSAEWRANMCSWILLRLTASTVVALIQRLQEFSILIFSMTVLKEVLKWSWIRWISSLMWALWWTKSSTRLWICVSDTSDCWESSRSSLYLWTCYYTEASIREIEWLTLHDCSSSR